MRAGSQLFCALPAVLRAWQMTAAFGGWPPYRRHLLHLLTTPLRLPARCRGLVTDEELGAIKKNVLASAGT